MSDAQSPQTALPPHVQLIQMGIASFGSAALHAAAKLSLADHIGEGAMTVAEPAER